MRPETVKTFLQELALFSDLEPQEYEQLSEICRERTFPKGQTIVYGDDPGTSLFLIAKGAIKITVMADDGREHILGVLHEKDFFGEMSLLDGEPRSASAVALEAATVLSITRDDFHNLLRRNPEISLKILTTICKRLRLADRHVEALAFLSAPGRVARVLLDLAEVHGQPGPRGTVIHTRMTRQELGNIAGTSRETLTRVLMEFQDDGLIGVERDTVTLLDPKKLRNRMV